MCSIFGFVASPSRSPRLEVLRDIVKANIRRGPHAFGFAWLDAAGTMRSFKSSGNLCEHLQLLSLLRGARVVIGHLRFATHGDPAANINNHPHPVDGGWLVHNGVVTNYDALVRSRRLWTNSDCDSESIGLMIEDSRGRRIDRVASAVKDTDGRLALMALWPRPGRFILARRGNPLHCGQSADGMYFATLAPGLPDAVPVPDNRVIELKRHGGKIIRRLRQLPRPEIAQDFATSLYDPGTYRGG